MKSNCLSKMLLPFSILSLIVVGCGKEKQAVYKVKLGNVNHIGFTAKTEDYTLHGTYEDCSGKVTNSPWILNNDSLTTNLEVLANDKACKLNLTKVQIGLKNYEYIGTTGNTLGSMDLNLRSIEFTDSISNENIYLSANMTPADYSDVPNISIKITALYHDNSVSKPRSEQLVYLNASPLFVNAINYPEYKVDVSNLVIKFEKQGKAQFNGDLNVALKDKGQKASNYFIVVNNSINSSDYNEVNEFYNDTNNAAFIKTITDTNSFDITGAEMASLTDSIATEKDGTLDLKVILVNSENGVNSYAVHKIEILRPTA